MQIQTNFLVGFVFINARFIYMNIVTMTVLAIPDTSRDEHEVCEHT